MKIDYVNDCNFKIASSLNEVLFQDLEAYSKNVW